MQALAEFERDLIRERIQAGLAAARARGRLGGRPRKLSPKKLAQLRTLAADKPQRSCGDLSDAGDLAEDVLPVREVPSKTVVRKIRGVRHRALSTCLFE
jgi:DNA invertase Pin-like site-specific DNA recombinase